MYDAFISHEYSSHVHTLSHPQVKITYGAAEAGMQPRRSPNLVLAFALIAAALVACVGIITYAKSTNALAPVETFQMTKLGTEYMVRPHQFEKTNACQPAQ